METQWRRERQELYSKLERSAENGLNHDAVLASRELFTFDALGQAIPKEFTFQHSNDAVTVVCAEIPRSVAEQWGEITREILQELTEFSGGDSEETTQTQCATNIADVYVSNLDIMHVTLFYTSHPDDLASRDANKHKSERLSREIGLVRELATQFEPIRMTPVKVILAAEHFTSGVTLESKPYVFPSENDAVALICAPVPSEMAKRCHDIGTQLTELLHREPESNNAVSCVTRQELMHVTLFHTSHPGDLAPDAKLRFPEDITQLKAMCKHFAPFCMAPVRVLITSSGAIIMIFKCMPAAKEDGITYDDEVVNKHAEFSVDHVRHVAKENFSYAPKTETRVIIHSTLGRVLSPDISEEDLDRLRAKCEEITAELVADPQPALFDKLWYVQETHHLSPQGPRTDIPLLGGVQLA
ncbi:hypothetical protein BBO99_00005663 [Phytophthora kernoviae]|uniref:Uncharacterized protein n=1 Tax=Phytophthora kernoviae TaxID=325452 RepID=A0A3R7NF55_9STRA|nr:hypothetical protein BBI17_005656 [Phytophthora kernoviae]RLN78864.1 hypothetical protein BBO99_00005663 [Phytophthora kernoviae]